MILSSALFSGIDGLDVWFIQCPLYPVFCVNKDLQLYINLVIMIPSVFSKKTKLENWILLTNQ